MNSVVGPLIRSLAAEFYRLNSGFFLLIVTLTFGFMSKVEHVALAQALGSSPYTMMIAVGVWLIYAGKIMSFNRRQLRLPENLVLAHLDFVPFIQRTVYAFIVFALQFFPSIAYGIFIGAAGSPSTESFVVLITALAGCSAAGAGALLYACRLPRAEKNPSSFAVFLDRRLYKSVIRCYLEHVIRRDPLMVVATKVFSASLLIGVGNLYKYEPYDERLLMMALTVCGLSNLLIAYRIQEFEFLPMAWWRNLPIAVATRYFRIVAALCIFLLPEFIVLLKLFPIQRHAYTTIFGLAYLASIGCLLAGVLQSGRLRLTTFTKKGFLILTVLILSILFGAPASLIAATCFVTGFTLFTRYYYSFEPLSPDGGINKPFH
jgi:hypothetical protein